MSPKWNYFTDLEVQGLDTELVARLDQARHVAGVPFTITDGLRTQATNTDANAVKDSAHLKGLAVDLACSDSVSLWKILNGLFLAGFKRIGVYVGESYEVEGKLIPTHIHVDTDSTKPQEVVFLSLEL